jgi:hypothetical protein
VKYIMLKVGEQNVPVIFPDTLVHSTVYGAMLRVLAAQGAWNTKVVAAGMCNIEMTAAYGESETLSIESRGERDKNIVNQYSRLGGLEVGDEHTA